MASPKLFTSEFNPVQPPTQPAAVVGGVPLALGGGKIAGGGAGGGGGGGALATKGISLSLGGGKLGGINVTPQLIQQLLASASKVGTYLGGHAHTLVDHTLLPRPSSWRPRVLW